MFTAIVGAIVGFVTNVVSGVVSNLIVLVRWPRAKQVRPFAFPRSRDLRYVFPPRDTHVGGLLPDVAGEDFMAMVNLIKPLAVLDFPQERIKMVSEDRDVDHEHNLILICGPWRNRVTNDLLLELEHQNRINVRFQEVARTPIAPLPASAASVASTTVVLPATIVRKEIVVENATFSSPSYDQQEALEQQGVDVWKGTLEDRALVIACRNPWNPQAQVLLVAGIRGIGTWGAAVHLERHARRLILEVNRPKDFAAIVDVTYNNLEITRTEIHHSWALRQS